MDWDYSPGLPGFLELEALLRVKIVRRFREEEKLLCFEGWGIDGENCYGLAVCFELGGGGWDGWRGLSGCGCIE